MYNRAVLMGRICNEPELKSTPSGVHVVQFRLAVDRSYQAKGEERKTDFFNIVAWRGTAEFITKYFSKGRMILVDGELQTRQYQDKNGSTQTVVELVVDNANFTGEPKTVNSGYGAYPTPPHPAAAEAAPAVSTGNASDFAAADDSDDDYPF